jgi:hypothetical protein
MSRTRIVAGDASLLKVSCLQRSKSGCSNVEMGQFLPRRLTERAAALPREAAAPTVRRRGSYDKRTCHRHPVDSILLPEQKCDSLPKAVRTYGTA